MRKQKKFLILILAPFFIGIMLFVFSFFLNISEFNSTNFTQLQLVCALRNISICFFVISIIFFFCFIFFKTKYNKNNERIIGITNVLLLTISLGVSIISVITQYDVTEEYYNILNENNIIADSYKEFFPYYNKMVEVAAPEEINYSYGNYQLFSNRYIHVQNEYSTDVKSPLYDVEYFSSNNKTMMYQYYAEKNNHNNGIYHTESSIDYTEYVGQNYYEIRIVNDKSFYSFYVSDFDVISNDADELKKTALQQYKLVAGDI